MFRVMVMFRVTITIRVMFRVTVMVRVMFMNNWQAFLDEKGE